jgi:ethylbenzene dioxygenase subunit beta
MYREAELLDEHRYREWLDCLTDDVTYVMPVRVTRENGESEFSDKIFHLEDNKYRLVKRVEYFESGWNWAETPPSRTRHLISNVRAEPLGPSPDELSASSYVVVYRSRTDEPAYEVLSARRQDVLRRVDGALKLARRLVLIDQATLGTHNLSFFL